MLTKPRLRDIEGPKCAGDLAIKPLTFLVGPNGTGKSAVLRALFERESENGGSPAPRYLGALRTAPARSCAVREDAPDSVGRHGENAVAMLMANGARAEKSRMLLAKAGEWMRALGVASEVSLRDAGDGRFAVETVNPNTGERANLADAGAGVSQILPIIAEGYAAPDGALILLEHPEAHLHPRAQGALGDLLIDISQTGKTLVVETHSESIIARVRTRVAQDAVSHKDAAVYHFEPTAGGARIREMNLNGAGQFEIEEIPNGFFTQVYADEFEAQMEAAVKRMKGEQAP